MADERFLGPLVDSWAQVADLTRLQECVFMSSSHGCKAAGYSIDNEMEDIESAWSSWVVELLASLTRHRYRHLLFYTRGPGILAGLLSDREEVRGRILFLLRDMWKGWTMCGAAPEAGEGAARRTYWLHRPLIQALLRRLEDAEWLWVPEEVDSALMSSFFHGEYQDHRGRIPAPSGAGDPLPSFQNSLQRQDMAYVDSHTSGVHRALLQRD